jgi:hypothetical protein
MQDRERRRLLGETIESEAEDNRPGSSDEQKKVKCPEINPKKKRGPHLGDDIPLNDEDFDDVISL